MPKCAPIKCPKCVPLFRYFVNQQPALLNQNPTFTPDCPTGHTCEGQDIPYNNRVIPDVGPFDPDINPDGGYQREADDPPPFNNSPRILVGNVLQKWSCKDEFADSEVDGVEGICLPGTVVIQVETLSEVSGALVDANNQATALARANFLQRIDSNEVTCFPPPWVFLSGGGGEPSTGQKVLESEKLELPNVTFGPNACLWEWWGTTYCNTIWWYSLKIGPYDRDYQLVADYDIALNQIQGNSVSAIENNIGIGFYEDGNYPVIGFPVNQGIVVPGSTSFWMDRLAGPASLENFDPYNDSGQVTYTMPMGSHVYLRFGHRAWCPNQFPPRADYLATFKIDLTKTPV